MPENFYENYYVLVPMEPRRDNDLKEAPSRATDEKFEDHPMWIRVQDMLVRALQPFAEARAAVLLGLDELFPASSP
jgi:hypothetical protein